MKVAADPLVVAAAIGAVLAVAALPVIALAHAELVSSDPPAGGSLTTTPYTLTATYDDELQATGSSIVVQTADGAEVARGGVSGTDTHVMTVELPALTNGAYKVLWTAVSADDEAVERGQYSFNVATAATSASPTTTPPPNDGFPGESRDLIVAVGLAAGVIIVIVAGIFIRGRR